jgi:hypothetical protein
MYMYLQLVCSTPFPIPCILSPVSCPLYPVPCILSPVSRPLYPVPCIPSPVSCPLYPVPSSAFPQTWNYSNPLSKKTYPLSPIPYPLLTPSTAKSWINRKPAPKNRSPQTFRHSSFGFLSSFELRHSSFPSPHTPRPSPLKKPFGKKFPPKNRVFLEKLAIPLPKNPPKTSKSAC